MAQPQKAHRQTKDGYAQRGKMLASAVQRVRGWVGSDPSRQPELGDALVALTGHRLRGHEFAAAGADAQDSVRQAAQLLTAQGPVGAYTTAVDAARYDTAVVQLASVQLGLGLAEPAGRTIASLDELHEQFLALRLELPLAPETVVHALVCTAAGALASGDVSTANATADDALRHLRAAGLHQDPDAAYLALDVDRLLSDVRWAAGRPVDALGHLHRARERWAAAVAGRLDAPAGLSPSLVERLAAPAFLLHRDLADRLLATGEIDLALVTRRTLVDLLRRIGAPGRRQLGPALADLATDLLMADRMEEADEASAESFAVPGGPADLGWPAVVRGRVLTRTGRAAEAVKLLSTRPAQDEPDPVAGLVHQVLAEAHRVVGDSEAAASAEDSADRVAAQLSLDGRDRLVDQARGVVSLGPVPLTWSATGPTVWDRLVPSAPADTEQALSETEAPAEMAAPQGTPGWLAAERSEARRHEEERSALARADADRREAEQAEAARRVAEERDREQARAAAEQRAADARQAAAAEVERQEVKRRREERLEAYRLEAERRASEQAEAEAGAAPAELAAATQAWQDARAGADRRTTKAAAERLVELLRPRAEQDRAAHGPLLQQVLAELAGLRMRGGDLLGARSASREAKDLARSLGR